MKGKKHSFSFVNLESKVPPTVAIDTLADAVYVYLQPGARVAKTVIRKEWPHVAIDLDEKGKVVGVEALNMGEFSIRTVMKKAALKLPAWATNQARYVNAKKSDLVPA